MAAVNISSVNVLENPAPFVDPVKFEIHYECLTDLEEDLEWKLTYVGSAEAETYDQILDEVEVGPIKAGKFKFILEADAPKADLIPSGDLVGVTVILLTCSYRQAEFIRVGYYTSIEYQDEALRENPPEKPILNKLWRHILAENPRVTRFQNRFDSPPSEAGDDVEVTEGEGEGDAIAGTEGEGEGEEMEEEDDGEEGEDMEEAEEEEDGEGGGRGGRGMVMAGQENAGAQNSGDGVGGPAASTKRSHEIAQVT